MPSNDPEYYREWRRGNLASARAATRRYKEKNPDNAVNGHLKRKYGITLEEYNVLLEQQGGQCAICRELPGGKRRLDVDHDHETSRVRGLLCLTCNAGMGNLKDDPVLIRRAAEYLEGGGANVGDSSQ